MTTFVALPRRLDTILFALPALAALAGSGRDLVTAVPEALTPLLPLAPGAPRSLGDEPSSEALQREGVGEAVFLARDGFWLAAASAARAGVPRRRAAEDGLRRLLLTDRVPRPAGDGNRRLDAAELLESMGLPAPEPTTGLTISPELERKALERLRAAHVDPDEERLIGLVPGPEHRHGAPGVWAYEKWAELAQRLRREDPRCRFVLLARPRCREDLWPAVRVHEETARRNPLIGPDLDPAGLAAVMGRLEIVVAADGDLLHLAAAAGAPTVGLFGPTDPAHRAPVGKAHRVLRPPSKDLRRADLMRNLLKLLT